MGNKQPDQIRWVAIAITMSGIAAQVGCVPSFNNLIVVPPTHLPAVARQGGEAMFLHRAVHGTTLLYIEQNQGARLAILDVTDPAYITSAGSVQLDAPGPFDFVAALGNQTELIRFRQNQQNAALDLHQVSAPTVQWMQEPLRGTAAPLEDNGSTVSDEDSADVQAIRDYEAMASTENSTELNRVFDAKRVRGEITRSDTGTTFVLTDSGLFVIRRPAKEITKEFRALDYVN
jgi:hypothetical protein